MRYSTLVLSLMLCVPALAAKSDHHVLNAEMLTVLVTNEGFLGNGRGSGILLDSKHVLTCAHMAESAEDELFVYTYPLGEVVRAHVEYVDVPSDIMLLTLDRSVPIHSKVVLEPITEDGEPITVIGNALGSMKWIVSAGVVSGRERFYVLSDARINHGNSGGPWVNVKGEVIGMTDWGISPAKSLGGISGAISAERILVSLRNYEKSKEMQAKIKKMLGL